MGALKGHWGSRTAQDVIYQIGFDFVAQLEEIMASEQMGRAELAEKLGVSKGRVSQILNDPGNLTLKNVVKYSEVLGRKVTIVTYDDEATPHKNGPVSPQVFVACWEKAGRPKDLFEAGIVVVSTTEVEIGAKWVGPTERVASNDREHDSDAWQRVDPAILQRNNDGVEGYAGTNTD
jgi:transcriptional regulator with XRE-family HTH domain